MPASRRRVGRRSRSWSIAAGRPMAGAWWPAVSRAATDSRAASRTAGGPSASPAAPIAVAPPEALYVHVPFCVSLCPYCDFVVVAGAAARGPRNRIGAYLLAVRRELELQADALDATWGGARPPLGSLYLGGGTPSLVAADDIADLVALVR